MSAVGPRTSESLVELRFVSPGYLESIRLRQVSGRFIDSSDTADSPSVVVVNERFVRQFVPSDDPVGRRVTSDDPSSPDAEWSTIVGVVEGVRHIDLATDGGPEVYTPVTQFAFEWATVVVRARSGTAEELIQPLLEAIHRVDPELPVFNVQSLDEVINRSLNATSFVTSLLVLFAATGLALSGVGVFSVVSYSVGRRLREVAIRMALGGSPRTVLAMEMRQGLAPVILGVALGVVVSPRRHEAAVQPALWRRPSRPSDLRCGGGDDPVRRGPRHVGAGSTGNPRRANDTAPQRVIRGVAVNNWRPFARGVRFRTVNFQERAITARIPASNGGPPMARHLPYPVMGS